MVGEIKKRGTTMRVLMTGATGFIGRKVLAQLVESGNEVVVLTRSVEGARDTIGYPCSFFSWEGGGEPPPAESFNGVDAIVHLAGEPIADRRWSEVQKKRIWDSRVLGTRSLVKAVQGMSKPPAVFLSGSAIGYYGDCGDLEVDESSKSGSGFLADVCKAWEAELQPIEKSCRVVTLRTGVVLGIGGGVLKKLVPLFQSGLGGPVGTGSQWMSWVHLQDLVSMIVWALEAKVTGAINGVAPNPVTNTVFSKELAQALKAPCLFRAPSSALKLALGEMSQVVLLGQRVLPKVALANGFKFQYSNVTQALQALLDGEMAGAEMFERQQFVPLPPEEIFPFFSEAKNLETLTPPWIGFKVLKVSTPTIQEGTLIDYRLYLHSIPLKWRTRIEKWDPIRGFVDRQLKGPYQLWHHTHLFLPLRGGTLMKDIVRYRLPLGGLGRFVAGRYVLGDVTKIFNYRRKKVAELFASEH